MKDLLLSSVVTVTVQVALKEIDMEILVIDIIAFVTLIFVFYLMSEVSK